MPLPGNVKRLITYASMEPVNTDTVSTTIRTSAVLAKHLNIFAFSIAILKFSRYAKDDGNSKTVVDAYSSFVLNEVSTQTTTGASDTIDAAINDTYFTMANIIDEAFFSFSFMLRLLFSVPLYAVLPLSFSFVLLPLTRRCCRRQMHT